MTRTAVDNIEVAAREGETTDVTAVVEVIAGAAGMTEATAYTTAGAVGAAGATETTTTASVTGTAQQQYVGDFSKLTRCQRKNWRKHHQRR